MPDPHDGFGYKDMGFLKFKEFLVMVLVAKAHVSVS
jgi:hypothetical protein